MRKENSTATQEKKAIGVTIKAYNLATAEAERLDKMGFSASLCSVASAAIVNTLSNPPPEARPSTGGSTTGSAMPAETPA
ncbi:MAG: hypothetical protein FWC26_00935, partial [Fibromonadales bacterium]|nr:hypothetical protein [Fibromonadales bacterium]